HDANRITIQRMRKGAYFPASKMSGEEEYASSAIAGRKIILQAIVDSEVTDVARGKARDLGKVGQLPAQSFKDALQDAATLRGQHLWKSHRQIAFAHAPQSQMEAVHGASQRRPEPAGHRTRQDTKRPEHQPYRRILN